MSLKKGILFMRLRTIIIRLIICVVAGFLISPAYSADKKTKKLVTTSERGLKVIRKGDGRRIALVIGNGDYKYTGHLANPVNDARLIAETLEEVGFELYGGKPQINLSRDDMINVIEGFGDRIGKGDTALFFYAGHGMQVKGENYLIPVNANIKNEAEVRVKSVESSLLFAKLEGSKNGLNIVILDACRNNPFGRSFRSGNSGLAQVTAPSGTIVAFSTAPNQVAEDGSGGNSTYTRELARFIKFPGLRVEDVFKRVRVSVEETTDGNQQPWENTSLKGDFSFTEASVETSERLKMELERKAQEAEDRARKAEEKASRAERQTAETQEKLRHQIASIPTNQKETTSPLYETHKQIENTSSNIQGARGFTVQVASHSLKSEAELVKSKLVAKGYYAFIVENDSGDKGVWYRVRVGRKLESDAAKELASKLGRGALVIPE